jgi:uncharacterized integral membrane protein
MSAIKLILLVLFVILVAMFTVLNDGSVDVKYYDLHLHVQTITVSMTLLVLGSFGGGLFLALLFTVFGKMRLKSQVRRKNREVVSLQRDINRLRPSTASGHTSEA